MTEDAKHYLQIKDGAVWGVHRGRCEIVVGADVCSTYGIHTFGAAVEFLKATRPHLQSVKFVQLEQGYPTPAAERGHGEHMTTPAMPELPEPDRTMWQHGKQIDHYTADQMRAYALATLQAQPAAAVSDEAARLAEQLSNIANGVRICGVHDRHFVSNRLHAFARAILALRPQAVPMTDERAVLEDEEFSLLSQTQVAALLWVLWCHQGASSPVGQPIRFALGMDKRQAMSDEQVSAAQRFRIDWHQWSGITAPAGGEKQA